MVLFRAAALGAALWVAAAPAQALDVRLVGSTLHLSGPLGWGSHHGFKAYVDSQPKGAIRVVALDSGGGSVESAQEIGRRVRKEGWSTFVDARKARCSSACTAVFAAGVRRHYVGAESIADGVVDPRASRGLGYHEGGSPQSLQPMRYSGGATAAMINLYYEFGSREAASLATKAPPNRMYIISGATALAKGIATSLGPP
jgi:hypothetical protein